MASEDTLIGNDFKVQVGDGNSPEVFTDLCAAIDLNPLGEEKPLVRTTSYCDDAETYRNGLRDGVEVGLQCNFIADDPMIGDLYDDFTNDVARTFRFTAKEVSPEMYFEFAAQVRAWNLQPPIGDRMLINFTLKITGGVTWVGKPV